MKCMRFRQKSFHICLTEAEYAKLEKKAKETGMKKAQLLRAFITDNEIRAKPAEDYLKLVREINAIGNNINQIAHIANTQKYVDKEQIKYIVEYLDDIMDKVREIG